ncbi:MAG: glycosyltransferase [Bacteroidetes bacterium]|jgi:glycosyltransferase involved in cell wall biosynthesis|nr:glycosyltransferase [Bacteroidota bacterium]
MSTTQISIIVPLYNEAESLPELSAWIDKVLKENRLSYEIIMVDDGSSDGSWNVIENLVKNNSSVRGIKFRRNYGKSAALHCGFQAARGEVVITMDADLQDSPDEIPGLYKMITEEQFDLVSGWKKKRYDNTVTKNLPSKLFNWTARKFSGIRLHDFNCGLKAYRNDVVKAIEVYGEMHRYIPIIASKAGFRRIGEKVVQHRKRKFGVTKFGFERFINGYLDLITISFISRFGKRPMHLFGTLGTLMFILGFIMAAIVGILKLIAVYQNLPARLVTESPYFFIALAAMILGTQLFMTGFLGELISRSSSERNVYHIEKEI